MKRFLTLILLASNLSAALGAEIRSQDFPPPAACANKPELGPSLQMLYREKIRLATWRDVFFQNAAQFDPLINEAYRTKENAGLILFAGGTIVGLFCPAILFTSLFESVLALIPSVLASTSFMFTPWVIAGYHMNQAEPVIIEPSPEILEYAALRDSLFGTSDGKILSQTQLYIKGTKSLLNRVLKGIVDLEEQNKLITEVRDGSTFQTRLTNIASFGHYDHALTRTYRQFDAAKFDVYRVSIQNLDYVITRLKSECDG